MGGTQAQFERIFSVRRKTGAGEQLASSTRLASIAAALLGVPCVRFYQDQLFFKRGGDADLLASYVYARPSRANHTFASIGRYGSDDLRVPRRAAR